jgi:hypothetical protein
MIDSAAAIKSITTQIRDVDFHLSKVLQLGSRTLLGGDCHLSDALDMVVS